MRVITGTARGRKLSAPPGLDTRPTAELVKEAVFSMIQFEIEGARVLDLFAGSGQMGIEALSRGASACVFVETGKDAQKAILENLSATGFSQSGKLIRMDAAAYLRTADGLFDYAFLDPPYQAGLMEIILPLTAAVMRESGVILCETDAKAKMPQQAGAFSLFREYRYGKTKITQYRQLEAGH